MHQYIDNIGSVALPSKVASEISKLKADPTKEEYESKKELYLLSMIVAIVDSKEKHVDGALISKAAKKAGIYGVTDSKARMLAVRNFFRYGMIDRRRKKLLDKERHVTSLTGILIQLPYYKARKIGLSEARAMMREWLFTDVKLRDFLKEHELCWTQFYKMIGSLSVSGKICGWRTVRTGKRAGSEIYSHKTIFDYSKYEKVDVKVLSHLTKYGKRTTSKYLKEHPEIGIAEMLKYQRSINVLRKYL
jgi:hypothetical protein